MIVQDYYAQDSMKRNVEQKWRMTKRYLCIPHFLVPNFNTPLWKD